MAKTFISGSKGVIETSRATYDFSVDGGALNQEIDLFKIAANGIIHNFWFEVENAVTSLASATLEVGVTGVDTDAIIVQSAKTVFVADYIGGSELKGAYLWDSTAKADIRKKFTAETLITLKIGTAALTAGKIHFYCDYSCGY